MKIIHLVKYYEPCKGGMESVVKSIVSSINRISSFTHFFVYSNAYNKEQQNYKTIQPRIKTLAVSSPFFIKSQPINFFFPGLRQLLRDNDVVHHHYPFPTMEFVLVRYLKLLKGKKFIITWHANIKNSRWSWIEYLYNPLISILLKRADSIVVTSPQLFEASTILQKYADKIEIVPLSFDDTFKANISRSYPTGRVFNLLFVGKLRKYKGVEYLIEAIKELPVKLFIVGNGEEYQSLLQKANYLDLNDKIVFEPNADDNALLNFYKNCDLFILPSVNEAEAFGVVQLEAMANGLPVINTLLKSGVPHVSLNNETGITVLPKDSNAIKNAIINIIRNKERYELFSKNALERVKIFSEDTMATSYLNIYRN